ncbi:EndoU domain-containing protein [Flavobacterium sediminilitoris]|uniref:EndoU domain-containing protein n=1 Tax=Flavobacterium sediminilitoris TaxID=2024526 RepID=A0ABY4HRJ6_9FLAO|nr:MULTISPECIES: EndoU domain-containing protein [Flavobacterium]UOX34831.1 EndoU domain-containing protein [Flavobacterium sediminilitoris]
MFPVTWGNKKIMNAISEVATSNPWIQQTGRVGATHTRSGDLVRYKIEGVYEGVKIKVITTVDDIITAFPIQ